MSGDAWSEEKGILGSASSPGERAVGLLQNNVREINEGMLTERWGEKNEYVRWFLGLSLGP